MERILKYLKKNGQRMDSEIASGTGIPREEVRKLVQELAAQGEISTCSVTRFHDGKSTSGVLCRIAGYIPPSSPGRKPGAQS
jgi:predicted ArsR family transcriptional regulator